jgi:uncharacterized membrane protein YjdF
MATPSGMATIASGEGMKTRPTPLAVFASCNAGLFAILLVVAGANAVHPFYRGPANINEFLLYSFSIAVVTGIGWRMFRRVHLPAPVLILMQLGILGHLLGGFVAYRGARLYDGVFFGMEYDHYLHMLNGLAGALVVDRLLPDVKGPAPRGVIVVLVMMGAGSIVEMIEYLAYLLIPTTGVGGYDNNMRDLVSNTVGGLIFLAGQHLEAALRGARRERRP